MYDLPALAARAAARHPVPTLPLDRLVGMVARERPGPAPDAEDLREALTRRPDLFRVLDAWPPPSSGRKTSHLGGMIRSAEERPGAGRRPREAPAPGGTWVLFLGPPDEPPDTPAPLRALRRCLLELGRSVDEGSRTARARWVRSAREADRVAATLTGTLTGFG